MQRKRGLSLNHIAESERNVCEVGSILIVGKQN